MEVISLTTSYMESNCFLIIEGNHAVVVDPCDSNQIIRYCKKKCIVIDLGILTHEHCDHTYGCSDIRNYYQCNIYSSKKCDENLRSERKNFSKYYEGLISVQTRLPAEQQKTMVPFTSNADITFSGDMTFNWMGHQFYLRETPGHSEGSICIVVDDKLMFSGDTLMWEDTTETRFGGGNKKEFIDITLPWIQQLSNELIIYAGHQKTFILRDRLKRPII